ncbi:ABC transporter permease [Hymenobacter wooponensis]|uniref:ABC transporter permease n=1 Tax=Hymenobacter wooponensis TaxID=1525360 RepID=UPI001436C926|nr:ABC transporter permease subunit [Hymenobacter wooponensis]
MLSNILGGTLGAIAGYFGNNRLRIAYGWFAALVLMVSGICALMGPLWQSLGLLVVGAVGLSAGLGWLLSSSRWGSNLLSVPLDDMIQALIALLDSIPLLMLILTVAAIQQPSLSGLIALLTITCWTTPARLLRAATLRTVPLQFVMAAEAAGLPPLRIVRKHIWPTIWPVLLARIPLSIALIIGLETTLSFLGVGLPPEVASWGRLLASSRLAPTAWWLIVCPGTAIFLTIWSLQALTKAKSSTLLASTDVTK